MLWLIITVRDPRWHVTPGRRRRRLPLCDGTRLHLRAPRQQRVPAPTGCLEWLSQTGQWALQSQIHLFVTAKPHHMMVRYSMTSATQLRQKEGSTFEDCPGAGMTQCCSKT